MPRHDPLRPGKLPRPAVVLPAGGDLAMPDRLAIKISGRLRIVLSTIDSLRTGKRGPGKPERPEGETSPVRPNRPLNLSGGAAAALNFDE